MNTLLPIVITAYNRPSHLAKTLDSLSKCINANQHDLHIYIDKADDKEIYEGVLEVAYSTLGFRHCFVNLRENKVGLAKNVIDAISQVIQEYPGVIALEDDMIVNSHFLNFMNSSFYHYKDNPYVGCITGYTPPIPNIIEASEHDLFASSRSSTWGWSMKKEDWSSISWEKSYFVKLLKDQAFLTQFTRAGQDRLRILQGYIDGKFDIWGIRRGAWQVENRKLTLYPKKTLLCNIGLDGSGVNCGINTEYDSKEITESKFEPNIFPQISSYSVNPKCEDLIQKFYS
jgi:hypothetical protein